MDVEGDERSDFEADDVRVGGRGGRRPNVGNRTWDQEALGTALPSRGTSVAWVTVVGLACVVVEALEGQLQLPGW